MAESLYGSITCTEEKVEVESKERSAATTDIETSPSSSTTDNKKTALADYSDEEIKNMAANALQDRRGINIARHLAVVFGAFSLICLAFGSSLAALILMIAAVLTALTWELITRPPINNPAHFLKRFRELSPPRPVLVCLGDSLTHGRVSDDWTVKVPARIAAKMKFDPPEKADFMDPLWVVNAGQNSITSWVVLNERLQSALACYPDYVMVMIGTNDVLAMYSPMASRDKVKAFKLPEAPSMTVLQQNIKGILEFISKASPKTEIGLCTLPPLGENLGSPGNKLVKQVNEMIHSFQDFGNCTVLEVGERLQSEIVTKNNGGKKAADPMMMMVYSAISCPLHYFLGVPWKAFSFLSGGSIMHDAIHLTEDGGDVVADVVVEWLFLKNIHKAIAVKQF